MKVHLMFADADFDPGLELPPQADDLVQDLQLTPVLDAMAAGDAFVLAMAKAAVIAGCAGVEQVEYRHEVLVDCADNPEVTAELYRMATTALEDRRRIHRSRLFGGAESRLHMSVSVLEACLPHFRRLRDLADTAGPSFRSRGFREFFAVLRNELDFAYLDTVEQELQRLRFKGGLLLSAELGEGNTGVDFVLRSPDDAKRSFWRRVPLDRPTRSFTIPDRDDASFAALGALRDDAVSDAAEAAAQSVDHVIDFFTVLRQETGFYLGCLNLANALTGLGHDVCVPEVGPTGDSRHVAEGLYDAGLALDNGIHAVPSDFDARRAPIVLITGANRGGKSTFLRAIGIAALLARCGAFAPASSYRVPLFGSVHTHFRREEDAELSSGKFDEELTRMATVADRLHPGALVLSNESFSSTNEREGSQIAEDVLRGLAGAGVGVVMVTHMFELAQRMRDAEEQVTFLRAERRDDGGRTYRILPGAPEASSHAMDLYRRIFSASSTPHA